VGVGGGQKKKNPPVLPPSGNGRRPNVFRCAEGGRIEARLKRIAGEVIGARYPAMFFGFYRTTKSRKSEQEDKNPGKRIKRGECF